MDNCVVYLSWSTYEQGIGEFQGEKANVGFDVQGKLYETDMVLQLAEPFFPLMTYLVFTAYAEGVLFDLLETGEMVSVTIKGPEKMVELLDIPTDVFSLKGIAERTSCNDKRG